MKKRVVAIVCALVAVVLLFPIRLQLKDGGTVVYKAILYEVFDVHSLRTDASEDGSQYNEGIIVEILGIEVFNNVK